jgi:RNA polymerase sigma factor (sigma-70 family)
VKRHGSSIYRYAWVLADEPNQVDDLLQDIFLVMWKRRRKVALAGDSMLPWLLTTCRYTAYNTNRRDRARRTLPLEAAESERRHDASSAAKDELVWVGEEIAGLSEVDRRFVELCLIDGRSYAEAATELGISTTAARKRIQRTRSRLASARSENA